jgi:XTP/dITP diphosphohydrolase
VFVQATGNPGKLAEMRRLLGDVGIEVRSQSAFDVEPVEETGQTFIENALLKARAAAATGYPAIADDSGLEVDALDGEPGVRSARFAGPDADDEANNRKLLERLAGMPPERRGARFRCVIVCLRHPADPAPLLCEGVWEGRIATSPRGSGGFGYDPLFVPAGQRLTAAELSADEKDRLSHRGQALRALIAALSRQRDSRD